jgi:hypothetical protein
MINNVICAGLHQACGPFGLCEAYATHSGGFSGSDSGNRILEYKNFFRLNFELLGC